MRVCLPRGRPVRCSSTACLAAATRRGGRWRRCGRCRASPGRCCPQRAHVGPQLWRGRATHAASTPLRSPDAQPLTACHFVGPGPPSGPACSHAQPPTCACAPMTGPARRERSEGPRQGRCGAGPGPSHHLRVRRGPHRAGELDRARLQHLGCPAQAPTVVETQIVQRGTCIRHAGPRVFVAQGPVLEARGLPIGVVTGIAGQTRLWVHVNGTQASAGLAASPRPTPRRLPAHYLPNPTVSPKPAIAAADER